MKTAFFSKYLTCQRSTYLYTYKKAVLLRGQNTRLEIQRSWVPIMTIGAVFSVVPGSTPGHASK